MCCCCAVVRNFPPQCDNSCIRKQWIRTRPNDWQELSVTHVIHCERCSPVHISISLTLLIYGLHLIPKVFWSANFIDMTYHIGFVLLNVILLGSWTAESKNHIYCSTGLQYYSSMCKLCNRKHYVTSLQNWSYESEWLGYTYI